MSNFVSKNEMIQNDTSSATLFLCQGEVAKKVFIHLPEGVNACVFGYESWCL